jgi:hypothetical protein
MKVPSHNDVEQFANSNGLTYDEVMGQYRMGFCVYPRQTAEAMDLFSLFKSLQNQYTLWTTDFLEFSEDVLSEIGAQPDPNFRLVPIDGRMPVIPTNLKWAHFTTLPVHKKPYTARKWYRKDLEKEIAHGLDHNTEE